jgi:ABC-type proline/glycine betaine transport system substrate-binding protein
MGGGGMGGVAGLLAIPEVVEHLKLDETQKTELKEVQQSMADERRKMFDALRSAGGGGGADAGGGRQGGGRGGFVMNEETRKKAEEFSKKIEDKISEILDPTQFDRLVGLFSQQSPMQAIRHRLVAEKMKAANCPITEEQETKMKDAEEAAGAKFRELMSGGFNPENMTKMGEIRKESEEKAFGALNDTQKKTFEEIKGEKFEFPRPQFGGPGGGRGGDRGGDRRPN